MNKFKPVTKFSITKPFPYKSWNVIQILIGINVGIYFLSIIVNSFSNGDIFSHLFGLSFAGVIGESPFLQNGIPAPWQLFTYMFAHDPSGLMHILFNMLSLWMIGRTLEKRIGSMEFLTYYLTTGFLAGLLHFALQAIAFAFYAGTGNETALVYSGIPLIGASGAVFAVLLAFGVYYSESQIMLFGIVPMKARNAILLFGGIEIFNLITSSQGGLNNVSNLTHLGGLLAGAAYLKIRKNINVIKILIPNRR